MLTDEQIKRFAELGGWVFEGDVWWSGSDKWKYKVKLPDFRCDLAACFDVLERFCRERKWSYFLAHIPAGGDSCPLATEHFNLTIDPGPEINDMPEACAGTKQECIMLAVIAAGQESK